MDAVSYSLASKQAQRIEKFIENPDSTSGIVTVPKVIASGETITIQAGRIAVLPNVQVDGVLNVDGEVFVPSGATFGDLEAQIALKQNVLVANDPAVKTALNATGIAPIYACRAWVNFNGTGTVAIRRSGNVSSITDNGAGNYTVNFTTAMPDANYSISGFTSDLDGAGGDVVFVRYPTDIYTSSSVQIRSVYQSVGYDGNIMSIQVFG